jgi:predicted molibdopterin-dependent oxidoreductase YjgC
MITIRVDGIELRIPEETSVAAALISHGIWRFRTAVEGAPRGPICAMGICFECRVTIDGTAHRRACMEICRPGMEIATGD